MIARERGFRLATGALVAAVGLALLVLAGCSKTGVLAPDLPPETIVFVTGPVDTVGHIVHLHWLGNDPDGEVVGYEFKWIYETGGQPAGYDSSLWTSTARTDSTFTVYTPAGYSMPTFVVRAVDNAGNVDPTPARETFQFRNAPPQVALAGNPPVPATTFPVVTIRWTSSDPDGNIANAHYLIWLDANSATPQMAPAGNQFTLTPDFFKDPGGAFVAGPHTVHVLAVDDGGAASLPDSATWNVTLPVGEVLLVDEVPSSFATASAIDGMYRNALTRQLGAGQYSIVDLELNNPFR